MSNDQLLAQSLRERYGVPVAFGAQTRAFAKILPVGLTAVAAPPAGAEVVDQEMSTVPAALSGIVEMAQSTEVGQLELLREDVKAAQQRLQDSRVALRIECERRRLEHEQQLVDLERTRLELERQRSG